MTSNRPWRSATAVAGLAVAVLGWAALQTMLVSRWPNALAAWAALVGVAALLAALIVGLGRRFVGDRMVRERARDAVLVTSLTVAAVTTVYTATVLAAGGRPSSDEADTVRPALLGALVAAAVVIPLSRTLARWSHRMLVDTGRPQRELLEEFGRRLAGMVPIDETIEQLADNLRPACAASAAEVWRWDGASLGIAAASPGRSAPPIDISPEQAAMVGRAGVCGAGWVDQWLPALHAQGGPVRVAPLAVQGALVGLLTVHRVEGADDFDDGDDEALARVARLVAAVLHNAELDDELRRTVHDLRHSNDELRSSRARLVTVADDERRRLERDLHDGAQAELAAVAVRVQLAKAVADTDPAALPGVLDEIERELRSATAALRTLAHGIFPPLLLTGGLADALAGVAARSPMQVGIGRLASGRYPREIEAAVYFCCTEAVHNAAKHAGSTARTTVDVEAVDGRLKFTVSDDGAGFDTCSPSAGGRGLTNMVDRLGALGGTLTITSGPGRGTTVCGVLPAVPVSQPNGSPVSQPVSETLSGPVR